MADMAWLRRLARGLVGDDAGGDDLAQETWVALVEKRQQPRLRRPYLAGIAKRLLLERRRKAGRRARHEALFAEHLGPRETESDLLETLDLQQSLLKSLRGLHASQREVLMLHYFEDLSAKEIAARLEMPAATVRSQLARGLAALRVRLDAETPGGRAAWLSALIPWTRPSSSWPLAQQLMFSGTGALVMKAVAVVVLISVGMFAVRKALWLAQPEGAGSYEVVAAEPVALEPPAETVAPRPPGVAGVQAGQGAKRSSVASRLPEPFRGRLVDGAGVPRVGTVLSMVGLPTRVTDRMIYSGQVDFEDPPMEFEELGSCRPDEDGRFVFPVFEPEQSPVTWMLTFSGELLGDGYRCYQELPSEPVLIDVDAMPSLGVLDGVVVDQDGVSLDEFEVEVVIPQGASALPVPTRSSKVREMHSDKKYAARTFRDAGGQFSMPIPLIVQAFDRFEVRVGKTGYRTSNTVLSAGTFREGQKQRFVLEQGLHLVGRVVGPDGAAIEGAVVRVLNLKRETDGESWSSYRVWGVKQETGADGRFELDLLPHFGDAGTQASLGLGFDSLKLHAPGLVDRRVPYSEIDFEAREVQFRLSSGGVLEGRLDMLELLRDTRVEVAGESGDWYLRSKDCFRQSTQVAKDGSFRIEGLPAGELFVNFTAGQRVVAAEQRVEIASGEVTRLDIDGDEWGQIHLSVHVGSRNAEVEEGFAGDDVGFSVSLYAPSGEAGAEPQRLASILVVNGSSFRLPSVGGAGERAFLRVEASQDLYFDVPLPKLGADIELGELELELLDFRTAAGDRIQVDESR